MVYRSVLHDFHLAAVVEYQRVVALVHEEMLHLPLAFFRHLFRLAVYHPQRELDSLELQFPVGGEVEDEIIEQLVGSLWHGLFCDELFQCIGSRCVGRIDACGVCAGVVLSGASRCRTQHHQYRCDDDK